MHRMWNAHNQSFAFDLVELLSCVTYLKEGMKQMSLSKADYDVFSGSLEIEKSVAIAWKRVEYTYL